MLPATFGGYRITQIFKGNPDLCALVESKTNIIAIDLLSGFLQRASVMNVCALNAQKNSKCDSSQCLWDLLLFFFFVQNTVKKKKGSSEAHALILFLSPLFRSECPDLLFIYLPSFFQPLSPLLLLTLSTEPPALKHKYSIGSLQFVGKLTFCLYLGRSYLNSFKNVCMSTTKKKRPPPSTLNQ